MAVTTSTARGPGATDTAGSGMTLVPVRHYGRWAAAVVTVFALGGAVGSLAGNDNLRWDIVADYLFADLIFEGLVTTLWLTAASMVLGVSLGTVIAVMRLSPNPLLRWLSGLVVWLFRGTPLLVQIIFWGYAGALYSQIMIGVPFTGITFFQAETNAVLTPAVAALLALGLNEAAYSSEIVRAGIQSVDRGQTEAAHSLGMRPGLTMRRIVLPQAMRVIIPPMGNETINMLKMTALVSVIAAHDLMSNIQDVYAQNYQVIPMLVVASAWYLAMVSLLSVPQAWLERRYGRGVAGAEHVSPLRRMLGRAPTPRRPEPLAPPADAAADTKEENR